MYIFCCKKCIVCLSSCPNIWNSLFCIYLLTYRDKKRSSVLGLTWLSSHLGETRFVRQTQVLCLSARVSGFVKFKRLLHDFSSPKRLFLEVIRRIVTEYREYVNFYFRFCLLYLILYIVWLLLKKIKKGDCNET